MTVEIVERISLLPYVSGRLRHNFAYDPYHCRILGAGDPLEDLLEIDTTKWQITVRPVGIPMHTVAASASGLIYAGTSDTLYAVREDYTYEKVFQLPTGHIISDIAVVSVDCVYLVASDKRSEYYVINLDSTGEIVWQTSIGANIDLHSLPITAIIARNDDLAIITDTPRLRAISANSSGVGRQRSFIDSPPVRITETSHGPAKANFPENLVPIMTR